MTEIATDPETIHVFAADLSMPEAEELAEDGAALTRALGGVDVEADRVMALNSGALGDLGLATYLVEGEGVTKASLQDLATQFPHPQLLVDMTGKKSICLTSGKCVNMCPTTKYLVGIGP